MLAGSIKCSCALPGGLAGSCVSPTNIGISLANVQEHLLLDVRNVDLCEKITLHIVRL
jgi:hypothetical protein